MASQKLWVPKGYQVNRTTVAGAGNVNNIPLVITGGQIVRLKNIFMRVNVNTLAANTGFIRVFHFVASQIVSFLIMERNIAGLATTSWEYACDRLMDESDDIVVQDTNTGAVAFTYNVTLHTEEFN